MLNTDKAFDLLPYFTEIWDKIEVDEWRKSYDNKNKTQTDAGIDLVKFFLKNSAKIKIEVFEIIAIFSGKSPEEVKEQSFMATIAEFKALLTEPGVVDFFKQAV